jgi:capsular polysaccharide transport system ATP-binding protein
MQVKSVFTNINLDFPERRCIGVLGQKGVGKSTLLSLLCRREKPQSGSIELNGQVSTPLGAGVGFTPGLTGRENIKFISRLLGISAQILIEKVENLAQLEDAFDRPVSSYDNSQRQRLVFASVLTAEYDWYLADEKVAVDAPEHRDRYLDYFGQIKQRAGVIIASSNSGLLSKHCNGIVVLDGMTAIYYDDVAVGVNRFRTLSEKGNEA